MYAGPLGGSSVPTYYDLIVKDEVYADGAAKIVFIDMEEQKAVRIPENLRAKMS
jgi:acyl-CoA thioester hydrolase